MKRYAGIFCIILFIFVILNNSYADENVFKDIADKISAVENRISNKTAAIFPFNSTDGNGKDGIYCSEKILHELVSGGRLKIVEREALDKVVSEQELNISGAVSQETAVKIGKLLAVGAMITGTVSRSNDRVEIFVRVIDTGTGQILASVSGEYIDKGIQAQGFTGTWKVTETAKYFLDHGIKYKKLILKDDDTYELHLINNANRLVTFKGNYEIDGNNIDYRPLELMFDGAPVSRPSGASQKGTIYLVDGKLYFTIIDMDRGNKRRLDAMDERYRNIAERK